MQDWLRIAPEVREARAVVALESTIITHGMPYPQNLETARSLERAVRECGAAAITVESPHTVAPHLTAELVYARLAANRS